VNRVTKALCASVLPLAGVVASVSIAPTVGGASAARTSQWAQLQQRAIAAIQAHVGEGALVPEGVLGREVHTTFTDAAGKAVTLDRRALTVRSTRTGSSYELALSVLGGRQEVVSALGRNLDVTAVFRPDSARVAHYSVSAATAPRDAGGCGGYASVPEVEGTIFGILIEGTGYVQCNIAPETLSELVGIFSNNSEVGNLASGSGYTSYLVVDDWAPCYLDANQSPFQTRMIWAENGTIQGGYTSANASYGCEA